MQKWYLLKLLQESGEGEMKESGWGGDFMYDIVDTFTLCKCHSTPTHHNNKGKMKSNNLPYSKETQNPDNWWGCAANGTPACCWQKCKLCSRFEGGLTVPYKTKSTLIIWPRSCAPWYLLKKAENLSIHRTCEWMFIAALFIIAPNWKQTRCPE
jgi:hypothetical protein